MNSIKLGEIVKISRGIEYGYNSKYVYDKKINAEMKPLIAGRCITRYNIKFENKWIFYNNNDPSHFKSKEIYETEKILMRRIGHEIIAAYDSRKYYNVCDVYNIILTNKSIDTLYILGILNSKLMSFYLKTKFVSSKRLFPKIPIKVIKQLPIKLGDSKRLSRLTTLVHDMLALHEKLNQTKNPKTRKVIQKQIEITDKKIDRIVYKLYGLSEEEIRIVESREQR